MANNYESTVMLDSYEVSVWNDVYDNTTHRFTEEKIAVIGSNTMTTQFRVLDPTLTENTNGTKTLTFSIYYRYIDHLDGIEKINPFIKLLIVERKIKLHWKDEWYDFIIKQRVESSDKHSFIYTCESLAANELTKTGIIQNLIQNYPIIQIRFGIQRKQYQRVQIGVLPKMVVRILEKPLLRQVIKLHLLLQLIQVHIFYYFIILFSLPKMLLIILLM